MFSGLCTGMCMKRGLGGGEGGCKGVFQDFHEQLLPMTRHACMRSRVHGHPTSLRVYVCVLASTFNVQNNVLRSGACKKVSRTRKTKDLA